MVTVCPREPSAVWLDGAIVTPLEHDGSNRFSGGVYSADRRLCKLALRPSEKAYFKHTPAADHDKTACPFIAGTFLYGGIIFDIFGHDLFEMPTRLWPIVNGEKFDGVLFHGWKKNLVGIEDTSAAVRHVMDCFSIPRDRGLIVARTALQVERLLVPEICLKIDDHALPMAQRCYDLIRDMTAANPEVPGRERIYLSRMRLAPGRIFEHEPLIQDAALRSGFAVVHPQELPLPVQIKMMGWTRFVCGLDGSALHLITFSYPKTEVLCLNTRKVFNANQKIIEDLMGASSVHLYIGDKTKAELQEVLQTCFSQS